MKKYFVIGAAWTSMAAWVEQGLNLIVFVIIARLIGTEEFGLASMALAFVLFGEVLVRNTLTEGIIERQQIVEGFLEATFTALIGFGLFLFFILAMLSPLAAVIYGQPTVSVLMLAASVTVILIAGGGVSTAILRRNMAFRTLAIRSITGVMVGGVVGIYLAVEGYGAWSVVGQRLAMSAVNSVIAILAAGWWPKRLPTISNFALIGGLGPQIVILRAAILAMLQTPTVVLGVVIGPHAVAVYALTWRFVEVLLTLIVTPIKSVAQSTIAIMRREGMRSDKFFLELTQIIALAGFTSAAGLALIADPVVELTFGPDWRDTVLILPWICLVGAMQSLTDLQESYLMAWDSTRRYVKAVVIEAIACIVFLGIVSSYGIVYAAAAYAFRAILFFPIRTRIALTPENISAGRYVRTLFAPCIIALAMVVVLLLWRAVMLGQMPDIVYLVATVMIGVSIVGAILAFLTPSVWKRLMSFVYSVRQEEVGESLHGE